MGENLSQKSRKFRSRAEILELISQQELSGLSVKAFCRSNSLSESSFNNWLRRYKNKGVRTEGSFAAVYVQPTPGGALFAEIRGIKIYQPVSAVFLKELAS